MYDILIREVLLAVGDQLFLRRQVPGPLERGVGSLR